MRIVFQIGFEPACFFEYAFVVRECSKSIFTMIGSGATFAHTAKGQSVVAYVHNGIVHAAPTEGNFVHNLLLHSLIDRKHIA